MAFIKALWQKRIVRFAFIGGIGLPINLAALACFLFLLPSTGLQGDLLEAVATLCAFEITTIINFVLNQYITYPDQIPTTFKAWIIRIGKAQLANISAFLVTTLLSIFLSVVLQLNPFISNTIGIGFNFAYKFLISDRFVFRTKPTQSADELPSTAPSLEETVSDANTLQVK